MKYVIGKKIRYFKLILFVILANLLAGCEQYKSVNVYCLSYDGKFSIYAYKSANDFLNNTGNLGYATNGGEFINADINDVKYTNSNFYEGAELIQSQAKGIDLVLMPHRKNGIAIIWKDSKGEKTNQIEYPVLCYKTNPTQFDH